MEWLPRQMWLTYLTLDTPASELDYDLAVSAAPGAAADFADTGVPRPESLPIGTDQPGVPAWPVYAGVGVGVLTLAAGRVWTHRHRRLGWGQHMSRHRRVVLFEFPSSQWSWSPAPVSPSPVLGRPTRRRLDGDVTVQIDVHHSRFRPDRLTVIEGTGCGSSLSTTTPYTMS